MAAGGCPDLMLLEDANDVVDFLEHSGRTVPRGAWCADVIAAREAARVRRFAGGLV